VGQVIMPSVQGSTTLEEVKNTVAIMIKELSWLLNNLDTRNVNELNAEVITALSITAEKIAADAITAEKIDVNELSAITANLGHITAGLIEAVNIFGSYIATSKSYPRCEMSSTGNVFGAFSSAQHYIAIDPAYAGTPALKFYYAGLELGRINNMSGVMDIVGTGGIDLYTGSDNLRIPSFGRVVSATGQNLGVELDGKATAGISTSMSGAANGGIPIGTVFKDVNGVNHTWNGVPLHSHAQN